MLANEYGFVSYKLILINSLSLLVAGNNRCMMKCRYGDNVLSLGIQWNMEITRRDSIILFVAHRAFRWWIKQWVLYSLRTRHEHDNLLISDKAACLRRNNSDLILAVDFFLHASFSIADRTPREKCVQASIFFNRQITVQLEEITL